MLTSSSCTTMGSLLWLYIYLKHNVEVWNGDYSGTSLLWTPWGPSKVSWCPHFRGKFLLRKHIWDIAKCPQYKGVLISVVSFKRGSTVVLYITFLLYGILS